MNIRLRILNNRPPQLLRTGLGYATVQMVRSATGLSTAEVSDSEITQYITEADGEIERYTGEAIGSGDSRYVLAQAASTAIASAKCFRKMGRAEEKAEESQRHAEGLKQLLGRDIALSKSGPGVY